MTTRHAVPLARVTVDDPFWTPRQDTNRQVTLPLQYDILKRTGALDALRMEWREGQPNPPHPFWESDVAKWIEAAAYSLTNHPDADLEARVDAVVETLAAAQQPDGYLNVYYSIVEPGKRWTNLRDKHELYCAGHLIEAAVAYYEATGKRAFLDVMCRYADCIDRTFGPREGQRRGYPGHEEIELALIKLYRATDEERYLRLAQYFIDERGAQPHYFDIEARARGEDPAAFRWHDHSYSQSHVPVREQTTAEGHAVRAMYLYSGMADVAALTGDDALLRALRRLWRNVTERRMYVTGGIGSSARGERFTWDYDLPNATAYAETCASIGLIFWAQRMLMLDPNGAYGDAIDTALYNGVLSGVSLDGTRFFYSNPLEVDRMAWEAAPEPTRHEFDSPVRQEWFRCACCPPNLARLLASLGTYAYAEEPGVAWVHLYIGGRARLELGGTRVTLTQESAYPWDGHVLLRPDPDGGPARFTLAVRVPAWCREPRLTVNGEPVDLAAAVERGYAFIDRVWSRGDRVELSLPMLVERVHAHPRVSADAGRVALRRGPLVYCLEEADNVANLNAVTLPPDGGLVDSMEESLIGPVVTLRAEGAVDDGDTFGPDLYRAAPATRRAIPLKAIPYYAWANRGLGSMLVWIREAPARP